MASGAAFLDGIRLLEIGDALSASVCGRLFAELGSEVLQARLPAEMRAPESSEARSARRVTDALKRTVVATQAESLAAQADLIIAGGRPADLERMGWTPERLQALAPGAVVVTVTPFGWTGPYRDYLADDLTIFHASGMSRLLLGAVPNPAAEPPVRAAGEQSEFIAGVAAATAAMAGLYGQARHGNGTTIDVSVHEALATMAARELASPTLGVVPSSRTRRGDVLGASVVLPASDGWVSISPRETHQWARWVEVLGSPAWAAEPKFATNADRLQHAGELIANMSAWTRERTRQEIYAATQEAHVPCFPVNFLHEVFADDHLTARGSFMPLHDGAGLLAPAPPFGLHDRLRTAPPSPGPDGGFEAPARPPASDGAGDPDALPLAGRRILDFSWVIAGPTSTQYLATFGAEVVKIESPTRPDPGRRTALHDVLGRTKLNLSLDLKAPGAREAVLRLAAASDVVVENFALGVMERLGIGEADLREANPDIIYVSSSGIGRTGPQADAVAYGTLVQCFVAFADLNGFPDKPPSPGFAWSDPLCGMLIAFSATAGLYARDRGTSPVRSIDHSMAEALLWTMPGSLVEAQEGAELPRQIGNRSRDFVPFDLYPAAGDDQWLSIAVTTEDEWQALCSHIDGLNGLTALTLAERRERRDEIDEAITAWTRVHESRLAMHELQRAGVPTGATVDTQMMFEDDHLWAREFYQPVLATNGQTQMLPRTPWYWPAGSRPSMAAGPMGADNHEVLSRIAGMSDAEIATLRAAGALPEE